MTKREYDRMYGVFKNLNEGKYDCPEEERKTLSDFFSMDAYKVAKLGKKEFEIMRPFLKADIQQEAVIGKVNLVTETSLYYRGVVILGKYKYICFETDIEYVTFLVTMEWITRALSNLRGATWENICGEKGEFVLKEKGEYTT